MKEENRGLYIIGFMVLASLLFVTLDIDLTNVQTDSSIIDLGSIISLTGFTIQQKLLSAAILILIPVIIGLVFILRMMNAKNYKRSSTPNNLLPKKNNYLSNSNDKAHINYINYSKVKFDDPGMNNNINNNDNNMIVSKSFVSNQKNQSQKKFWTKKI